MANLAELILFVSSTSPVSMTTLSELQSMNVPIANLKLVRLDTPETRDLASRGPHFQITYVPTLVAIYSTGNLQMYIGQAKIVTWLCHLSGITYPPVPLVPITPPAPSVL